MKDVSRVFHCAGLVSFSPNQRDELYKINVEVTANVVNAALHAGVQKMVHVSSVAATGRRRNGMRIEETMYWTPETGNSLYAQSKYLAEMEVWRGIAEGLDAAIVNPSIIFGAGDWTDGSTAIFKKVYDGLKWYSEGVTGFVDVEDVCKAMIMLMYSDVSRERFIISAHNAAYKDVMEKIADGFNLKRPHKKVTPFLAGLIWRIDYLKSIFSKKSRLITKETAATALDKVYFDNSKFLRFFPQFSYKDLSDTIQECCKQLLEKNK
jgi:nucleoside-diphosphate-sugar epimerase